MVLEDFINNTMAGINNPECSFFVGAVTGQALILSLLWKIAVLYFIIRIIDSWFFTPITNYVKDLINNRRKWGYWKW